MAPIPLSIPIPSHALVLLVGPSGCGKSTFARRQFRPSEVLSSDTFRELVADDENDQAATMDAFQALHLVAAARLKRARLTVVDATNLRRSARQPLLRLAANRRRPVVAIVFDLPPVVIANRNATRTDRHLPDAALEQQRRLLASALRDLPTEDLEAIVVLGSVEEVDTAKVDRVERRLSAARPPQRSAAAARPSPPQGRHRNAGQGDGPPGRLTPAAVDRRDDHGPFDIIGDVHGCADELVELLERLGYRVERSGIGSVQPAYSIRSDSGRRIVLLGDLVDRGPATPDVLALAMAIVGQGVGHVVIGNHDWKLLRALWGRHVRISHGLAESLAQLDAAPPAFRAAVAAFLASLPGHLVLDSGRLVVAHAGLRADLQGSRSGPARDFAMYGETTGESDEFGLPVRVNWALEYAGSASVVYGHTAVREPEWINDTIDIDTGCVFGGRLTALRWPGRELVFVNARRTYYAPGRPIVERIDQRPYLGGEPA